MAKSTNRPAKKARIMNSSLPETCDPQNKSETIDEKVINNQ